MTITLVGVWGKKEVMANNGIHFSKSDLTPDRVINGHQNALLGCQSQWEIGDLSAMPPREAL